ncbi:RbsD/FucU domain-containing protein [Petroclostridium sp. X23]|uniref:RbsD/FucU family protein n=1 Tax=Petroclostridium sp. X23 TaxID=3045146 RepID=UPI0024AE3EB6|nr:RbsD/FucU domain-containing protein [Petroclostridium sp. X23]WHH58033.1 RbsD/FucU domain-containing protein [Petroclostridium sp. X23]
MLKGIPSIISPELLKILMEMGHGDEIVLADANFPAKSCAQRLARCDGHDLPPLLEAILGLFPLDVGMEYPIMLMKSEQEGANQPTIWKRYREIINKYEVETVEFQYLSRFEFYEQAKKAYAIIATGEKALYANMILKKGVITD